MNHVSVSPTKGNGQCMAVYGAESRNRTQATLVVGKCSHYYTNPAPILHQIIAPFLAMWTLSSNSINSSVFHCWQSLSLRENEGTEREAQGVRRDMSCPRKLFLDERKSLF